MMDRAYHQHPQHSNTRLPGKEQYHQPGTGEETRRQFRNGDDRHQERYRAVEDGVFKVAFVEIPLSCQLNTLSSPD
ncbi:MAG: hypothetical protein H6559_34345 [Lewinellaceae bacterium]|nr:hypothetical protein [Lewinellaceae bacterium]